MRYIRQPLIAFLSFFVASGSMLAIPPVPDRIKGITVPASRVGLFVDLSPYNLQPGSEPTQGEAVSLESLLDFEHVKTELFNETTFTQIPFRQNGNGTMAVFHDDKGIAGLDQATAVRKYYIQTETGDERQDYVATMIAEKVSEEDNPGFDFLDKANFTGSIFYSDLKGRFIEVRNYYNGRILKAKILKPDEKPGQGENVMYVDVFAPDVSGKMLPAGKFRLTDAKDFDHIAQRELIKLALAEGNLGLWKKAQEGKSLVGMKFRDLRLADPNGKEHKISDYAGKGQWVLVDFWASWCGPCKREMPNVTAAYKKYHDKGFEIVGLSFDAEAADWKDAIKTWDMPWVHLSDLKYWQSKAALVYGIHAIPDNLLIDPEGIIVARGLQGRELENWLAEIYK